jgi:hypothetical protein
MTSFATPAARRIARGHAAHTLDCPCVFLVLNRESLATNYGPGRGSPARDQEVAMQIDKQEVVDLRRKEGKNEHVQKALQELPDKIDQEQHAQMLQQRFGIDPGKLAEKAIAKEMR